MLTVVIGNGTAIARIRRMFRLLAVSSFILAAPAVPLGGTFLDGGEPSRGG
jgi:hypothetical protein